MRTLLSLIVVASLSASVSAQNLWRGRVTQSNVGIEFLKPNFTDRNAGTTGLVTTLSGAFTLRGGTALVVEMPFIFSSYSSPFGLSYDESALGNPYLGLQFGPSGSSYYGDIGVRLPLMDEHQDLARGVATLADIDRFEAYIPHVFQASAAVNFDHEVAPSLRLLARIGPSFDVSTSGRGGTNLYADYGVTFELQQQEFSLGAGYSARMILTSDAGSIDDRTIDEAVLGGYFRIDRLEPGLQARFPLDEYLRREITATYLVSLRLTM